MMFLPKKEDGGILPQLENGCNKTDFIPEETAIWQN